MKAEWIKYDKFSYILIDDDDNTLAMVVVVPGIVSFINQAKPPRKESSQGMVFCVDNAEGLADGKREAEQVARNMGWEFELVPESELG